ncbi:MAG: hypothetical protein RLZZ324_1332 [Candidatus Parcubacteria bacterium]|jgi:type IV pilus assembly protein PilM
MFNPFAVSFGLDIGDRTFKMVQVVKKRGRIPKYRLVSWGSIDVPEGVMDKGDVKDMPKAVECLQKLIKESHGRGVGHAAVACLPEAKTFIKIIDVPRGADHDAQRKEVISEIERNIPLPLDEIYFDWQVVESAAIPEPAPVVAAPAPAATDPAAAEDATPAEQPAAAPVPTAPQTMQVLLGAAPKKLADDYTAMLEKAGLSPLALEIEAMSIGRAIVPDSARTDEAVGILDIGATRSSLVISDNGALRMSISIPISGIAITEMVSESLNVSMDDAEKLKRECGLDIDRCEDRMWKILLPLIDDMSEKVRNALRFYRLGFPEGKKIETIYLCGGGAQFHGIDTVLSRKLAIKVRRGDALANLTGPFPHGFSVEESLQYATAIGLGIRAADDGGMVNDVL